MRPDGRWVLQSIFAILCHLFKKKQKNQKNCGLIGSVWSTSLKIFFFRTKSCVNGSKRRMFKVNQRHSINGTIKSTPLFNPALTNLHCKQGQLNTTELVTLIPQLKRLLPWIMVDRLNQTVYRSLLNAFRWQWQKSAHYNIWGWLGTTAHPWTTTRSRKR